MPHKILLWICLFAICIICACSKTSPVAAPGTSIADSDSLAIIHPIAPADTTPVDSAEILRLEKWYKIRRQYADAEEWYDRWFTDSNAVEVHKFNLNGDSFPDYYALVCETMIGRQADGWFVDGRTGATMRASAPVNWYPDAVIYYRPISTIQIKIVDIDCEDDRQELMTWFMGGFPMGIDGFTTDLWIFRYNADSASVETIFAGSFAASRTYHGDTSLHDINTNYIDILYKTDSCINEITVTEGYRKPGFDEEWERREKFIEPRKDGKVSKYVFDKKENKFRLKP